MIDLSFDLNLCMCVKSLVNEGPRGTNVLRQIDSYLNSYLIVSFPRKLSLYLAIYFKA